MPRILTDDLLVVLFTLTALLSPDITFYVQLYFLSKDSHGDLDAYVHDDHRDALRSYFGSEPMYMQCPNGDMCRDRMTIDGVPVEWKFSKHPKESAFAGSYGGFFYILLLPSIRGMYGQDSSIVDGHVVFTEGKVVVQIMTLHQFLTHHNFILSTSQAEAFPTIEALFDAWSKSTCFVPSAILHSFQKLKKRDERVLGMYNAFTAWLPSKGLIVEELLEKPVVTTEQCQHNAEKAFPEAWLSLQQALDAEKEAMKRIEAAKKAASVTSIVALGAIEKPQIPLVASLSRFMQGTQNEKDKKCSRCQECIALHEQFKAVYGGGDIYTAITKTCGTGVWVEYVKGMWAIFNSNPSNTQVGEN
jgi:hypothetical protein